LTEIISAAKKSFAGESGSLCFVVSLCGTEEDPQNYKEQKRKLEEAGAVVTESSTRAALLAGLIGSR
jgi:FdrA protein